MHADREIIGQVIAQEGTEVLLAELGILLIAFRSFDVAVALIAGIQLIFKSFCASSEGNGFAPAMSCSVPTDRGLCLKKVFRAFLSNDIDDTADSIRPVKYGGRSFNHFQFFQRRKDQ